MFIRSSALYWTHPSKCDRWVLKCLPVQTVTKHMLKLAQIWEELVLQISQPQGSSSLITALNGIPQIQCRWKRLLYCQLHHEICSILCSMGFPPKCSFCHLQKRKKGCSWRTCWSWWKVPLDVDPTWVSRNNAGSKSILRLATLTFQVNQNIGYTELLIIKIKWHLYTYCWLWNWRQM